MEAEKEVVCAFVNFVTKESDNKHAKTVGQDLATLLCKAYGISEQELQSMNYSPLTLPEVFRAGLKALNADPKFVDFIRSLEEKNYFAGVEKNSKEYNARFQKAKDKFYSRSEHSLSGEYKFKIADRLKEKGNVLVRDKKLLDAIQMYTRALEYNPQNQFIYANRAAAHSQRKDYKNTIMDCKRALDIDPNYSKAYSRLGSAYYFLGDYNNAVLNYGKALDLEPNNTSYKKDFETATKKQFDIQMQSMGGSDDMLQAISSNPMFMEMASKFMSGPGMSIMQNMMGGLQPQEMPPMMDINNFANKLEGLQSNPSLQAFQSNPKFATMMEDMKKNGPMAILNYTNDPEISEIFAVCAQELMGQSMSLEQL